MDHTAFGIVKEQVQCLLEENKVEGISSAQVQFYAEQVGELLKEFSSDDGRLKGLDVCAGKMLPTTCVGIFPILAAFSSDDNKVKALDVIASQISDPKNFRQFDKVFHDQEDRKQVKIIMNKPRGHPIMPHPMASDPYSPDTLDRLAKYHQSK